MLVNSSTKAIRSVNISPVTPIKMPIRLFAKTRMPPAKIRAEATRRLDADNMTVPSKRAELSWDSGMRNHVLDDQ